MTGSEQSGEPPRASRRQCFGARQVRHRAGDRHHFLRWPGAGVFQYLLHREGGDCRRSRIESPAQDARQLPPEPRLEETPDSRFAGNARRGREGSEHYGWVDQRQRHRAASHRPRHGFDGPARSCRSRAQSRHSQSAAARQLPCRRLGLGSDDATSWAVRSRRGSQKAANRAGNRLATCSDRLRRG